ncbi:TadE/TadG family type IV pilus assembly protein [Methylobacterium sp. J-068]|uniref:TadE/TadG family type IV pilus assembly protein n=1 Tax=Methylobacterium sp. J-068 TaxID=2836649 RepID=UPI001FBABF71|nr:TadE/TadG family type IV pilus assembly protein [Methylobacterium sp. J-068]MCJ2035380.1 pilus assembly protein [Methylobacterium sp. J-068]
MTRRRPVFRSWSRAQGRVRRFGRTSGGATAVEFALVMPLFMLVFVEILQGGLYIFCYAAIEKATFDASRSVMLGALTSAASTSDGFRNSVVCANLIAGLSCTNVVVSLQTTMLTGTGTGYSGFVNADETGLATVAMDNSQTQYCTGAPGTYGYLQVFYAVPVFSPIWIALGNVTKFRGSSVVFTRAAVAFRNEPFTTTSVSTGC